MRQLTSAIKRMASQRVHKRLVALSHSARQTARRASRCSFRVANRIYDNPLFSEGVFVLCLLIACCIALVVRP